MRKIILFFLLLLCTATAHAADLTNGLMLAVPTPNGRAPVIDGDLQDWDWSGAEPIWIAPQTAAQLHGEVALMYDDQALYYAAKISLPNRPLRNANSPVDSYLTGDVAELLLAADPALTTLIATPLDPAARNPATQPAAKAVAASDRIARISFWKDTDTNQDYLNLSYGLHGTLGQALNPPGTQLVIKSNDTTSYVIEARIPWTALHSPDGKNPFHPNDKMTALLGLRWGQFNQIPALYRGNLGDFTTQHPEKWGQIQFAPAGNLAPRHQTMAQAIAEKPPLGVPIELTIPEDNLKLSVNIFSNDGAVIRELVGGEPRPRGKTTVYFDGHDQWGAPLTPGTYKWGAYLSRGLQADYQGSAGTSGHPSYETDDGKSLWGGDRGAAIATAADSTGLYFLWMSADTGRTLVKTDYDGNVLWRKSPNLSGNGSLYALAANNKYVFVALGKDTPQLARVDARTGQLLIFPDHSTTAAIANSASIIIPPETSPTADQPECVGLAATQKELFASVYSQNFITVLNPETGQLLRQLPCPGPRGLSLDTQGNLYAVSFLPGKAATIVLFHNAQGTPQPIVTTNLEAPWSVAVDSTGNLHVSDLGASQQIKTFSPDGKLLRTLGQPGGRTWGGTYDPTSFLLPAGLAADNQGGLLVAEAALPKVMSRFDAKTGQLLKRWFGATAYPALDVPDPSDPLTVYYPITSSPLARHGPNGGLARAHIRSPETPGEPDAYWCLPKMGFPDVGEMYDNAGAPTLFLAPNGQKYMFSESGIHGLLRIEGDKLIPIGHISGKGGIELWTDLNGDGQAQPEELQLIQKMNDQNIGGLANGPGSLWMQPNGDLYLMMSTNNIIKIPVDSFTQYGEIKWDASGATIAVPVVLQQLPQGRRGWAWRQGQRTGVLGMRLDSQNNLYACMNATVPYATPELTDAMKEGLGHSPECNTVKFAKYAPDGHLLWLAGRKATSAARPGEMYEFSVMAGLVADKYIAAASAMGQIYFYTQDGFFVDALMNNPALLPPPGPYTFTSETFGGRIQEYPDRNQVWAYTCGMAYRVLGFNHGTVMGEQRLSGTVQLDKVYEPPNK